MNERKITELRRIEQVNKEQFSKIWQGLSQSDKVDYIGAIFWERIDAIEQSNTPRP